MKNLIESISKPENVQMIFLALQNMPLAMNSREYRCAVDILRAIEKDGQELSESKKKESTK